MTTLRNKVQLIGNLGGAPEVKTLDNGKQMVKFSLATNETYRNANGEQVTDTQWHNVIAWGSTAKLAEKFLEKGKEVAIEGKLSSRSYDDKDGIKRYITEIVANEILLIGKKAN
jgi:single-strand DNA-binding protein